MMDNKTTGKAHDLLTFDKLIQQRAVDVDQTPLLAYPKSDVDDYEFITGRDLNRFVDNATKALLEAGLRPVVRTGALVSSDLRLLSSDCCHLGRRGRYSSTWAV